MEAEEAEEATRSLAEPGLCGRSALEEEVVRELRGRIVCGDGPI